MLAGWRLLASTVGDADEREDLLELLVTHTVFRGHHAEITMEPSRPTSGIRTSSGASFARVAEVEAEHRPSWPAPSRLVVRPIGARADTVAR
jgi:hypothetical protein